MFICLGSTDQQNINDFTHEIKHSQNCIALKTSCGFLKRMKTAVFQTYYSSNSCIFVKEKQTYSCHLQPKFMDFKGFKCTVFTTSFCSDMQRFYEASILFKMQYEALKSKFKTLEKVFFHPAPPTMTCQIEDTNRSRACLKIKPQTIS